MRKKWKYLIPALVIAIAIAVIIALPEDNANADYIAGDIFSADTSNTNMVFQLVEDAPDGDYYYQTKSKHHTSTTVHQTIAIEFSALDDEFIANNGFTPKKWKYPTSQSGTAVDPHVYYYDDNGNLRRYSVIMGRYDDFGVASKSIVLANGQELNTWVINHDALWARIKQTQPGWYNSLVTRINAGDEYYMGIDPVITIIYGYDDTLSDDLDECQRLNYYLNANGQLETDENGYPTYY